MQPNPQGMAFKGFRSPCVRRLSPLGRQRLSPVRYQRRGLQSLIRATWVASVSQLTHALEKLGTIRIRGCNRRRNAATTGGKPCPPAMGF
jgi:hypothetical protein